LSQSAEFYSLEIDFLKNKNRLAGFYCKPEGGFVFSKAKSSTIVFFPVHSSLFYKNYVILC
jgi:hypothetical protein